MNNCPIGVFDSGVGGLSVFSELIKLLPDENYIYFGDTINLPYGNKTKEQLVDISAKIFDFFKSQNVKAVVMACNTTSALTYDVLKDKYNFKIYPVVQNVAKQIAQEGHNKIGVFATQGTINSHAYKNEIQKHNSNANIFEIACPEWVGIVENGLIENQNSIDNVKMHLDEMMINKPEKIILGCTHYPYLLSTLTKFAPKELFINPAKYFAQSIYDDLKDNELINDKEEHQHTFYVTSNPAAFANASKLFYRVQEIKEVEL